MFVNCIATNRNWRFLAVIAICVLFGFCVPSFAQINQNCTISILNHNTKVQPDGSWHIDNIPAGFGFVRARATCIQDGKTQSGESGLFQINANEVTGFAAQIVLGSTTPIPSFLTITSPLASLSQAGQPAQLSVTAFYSDGTTKDITSSSSGTLYTISNPSIATISLDGLITAMHSGTAIIQARNEGTSGMISIKVVLAEATHGGIPDSWAISHGLDPNNPNMPFEDPDHDGLTNLQEFQNGTDPHNPDTDGDGLTDGQEVLTYHTNPLLADTDGDGIPDGLEVALGTDPLDPNSFDYARAIDTLEIRAAAFTLIVNSLTGTASTQLSVVGHLIDGHTTIDLTSTRRLTNYASSDLNICNFGTPDGMIFAGSNGTCTITATNSGHTASARGLVLGFSPTSLSFVPIPGFANSVAVSGDFAYVAAGGAGLQIVNVSPDRTNPQVVSSVGIPGNANDVTVIGSRAYVAMGAAGLAVVDITDPLSPQLLGTADLSSLSGTAMDVTVRGNTAYVANGSSNSLVLVDITNPASMKVISSVPLSGFAWGVDVDASRNLAAVAAGANGLVLIDITNPAAPVVLGSVFTGDAREVALRGNFAFVADFQNSTTSVDTSTPSAPKVLSHILDPNLGGFLQDIVLSGNFALAADVKFVNGIPITDISDPTSLQARAILNFPQRDDNAMGIAVDGIYVYLATEHNSLTKGGSFGDSRLYIGQYQPFPPDNAGIPPTASITAPASGSLVVAGSTVTMEVAATDDVRVATVNFIVNGQVLSTSSSAPYRLTFIAPSSPGPMTLGATAVDFGNNVGVAPNILVNVIPDPGTTVVGRVVDINGNPFPGASVTASGHSATSRADGTFFIGDVPTIIGNLSASAAVTLNGVQLTGTSVSVPPVALGTTNVGDITVSGAVSFVPVPGFANAVAVSGDFGFVAAGGQGLQVVNLSPDRTNPQLATTLSIPGNANDVTLAGNMAYMAIGSQGLAAVDVTNPLSPQLLGTVNLSGTTMEVAVRGTIAYVAVQPDGNSGGSSNVADTPNSNRLVLVDLTHPAAMTVISSTKVGVGPGLAWGVDVDDSRHLAAVAVGAEDVYILDVSNPATPVLLGSVNTGDARAVSIRGNLLFVADRFNSLTSVDISDPANPAILTHAPVDKAGNLNDLVLSGSFALGADAFFLNGVSIVDISKPAALQPRAVLHFAARSEHGMGIAADNNFVYLATENNNFDRGGSFGDSRLYIGTYQFLQDKAGIPPTVSITSPATGATVIGGSIMRIQATASDDVGVPSVTFSINGQSVFTATAPPYEFTWTVPQTTGSVTLGAIATDLGGNVGTAQNVVVNVIADPGTTVAGRVVDLSGNPLAGATVTTLAKFSTTTQADGTFSIPGVPTVLANLTVSVVAVINGPQLSGASATFAPVPGGITNVGDIPVSGLGPFVHISGFANSVAVTGDFAYVAAGGEGLQIVGLSVDRTNPQIVGSLGVSGNANSISLAGNRAYLAMGSQGLAVVDITNASAPQLLGSVSIPGNAMSVVVHGSTAFVAAQSGGSPGGSSDVPQIFSNSNRLVIVDVTNPATMTVTSSTVVGVGPNGFAWGVDVDDDRHLAAVAVGSEDVYLLDVSNPAAPVIVGSISTGDARAVKIKGNFALVADRLNSLTAVDISNPSQPFVASQTSLELGGLLNDVALAGNLALGADVLFNASVPIIDISNPATLQPKALLSLGNAVDSSGGGVVTAARPLAASRNTGRNDKGLSVAADSDFIYLATVNFNFDRGGSFGDSRLYIGQFQALQDRAGIAPTVAISSPASGASLVEGSIARVQVKATDDIGVRTVNFLINGQVVFTSSVPPYEFTFMVPSTSGTMTLGANAVDFGGNVGTAQDIQVSIIPDPGTTVTGRLIDSNRIPIPGALITIGSTFSATTLGDGTFSIPGVPTVSGRITVNFIANVNGTVFSGASSNSSLVPGGITDFGDIVVTFAPRWSQLAPQGSLPPGQFAFGQAVYDETTDRMMVFSGSSNNASSGNVRILTGASGISGNSQWTTLSPLPDPVNGLPPPLQNYSPYDSDHNRIIVFVACDFFCSPGFNDVWILENANGLGGPPAWTKLSSQIAPGPRPTPRGGATATYDPATNTMTIFGGVDAGSAVTDVWILNNANGLGGTPAWLQLAPSGGPPEGFVNATSVYDPVSNQMIAFGGDFTFFGDDSGGTPRNSVWALTNANGQGGTPQWVNLVPEGAAGSPPDRALHSAVYDPTSNTMTIFGGTNGNQFFGRFFADTWFLSGANGVGTTPSWVQLTSNAAPSARCCHGAVLDPASNRMIMFGGNTVNGDTNDTWILADANGQALVTTSGGAATGQATLATGAPASNALVHISTTDGGTKFSKDTRTDANGHYLISNVPTGRTFVVRVYDPQGISFKDSASNTISVDGQSLTINVALPAVATVQLKVLGADGMPLAGARVQIKDSFKPFFRLAGLTDASGIVQVSVPEGGFSMQAQGPNIALTLGAFQGTVTANDSGATITGTITAPAATKPQVVVASGVADMSTGVYTNTSEVYDLATGMWLPSQNLIPNKPPDFAGGFCAANMTALGDGRVLFAGGGCSDTGITTNAASLFLVQSNQWSSSQPMLFGRDQFGMVSLSNGNALAFAGCAGGCSGPNILGQFIFQVGSSAEIYDFQANSWSQAGSLNTARGGMANGNFNQTAITLTDGRVLACNGNDGFSTAFDSCELYDPVANQWTVTGSIGETGSHPVIILPNGKVLAIMNDGLTAKIYDALAGTWSGAASLSSPQSHGILTALNTGEILLSGGSDGTSPVGTVQIYHPATDSWTTTAAMSAARSGHIATVLDDGRVLVTGGSAQTQ